MKPWHIPICLSGGYCDIIPPYSGEVLVTHRSLHLEANIDGQWRKIAVLRKNQTIKPDYVISDGENIRLKNPGKAAAYAYPLDAMHLPGL